MEYGKIKGLDKKISRLVFGAINMTPDKKDECFSLLDDVVSLGCNAMDSANVYGGGGSERLLGLWMEARGNREDIVILTKGSHHNQDRKRVTPFDISTDVHDSLARLRTDYIDVYMLHRDDPDVEVGPIVERLNELKIEGKISTFGGSNWTHTRIAQANEYAYKKGLQPFTASSPNFGLAEQVKDPWGPGCVTLSGPNEAVARKWYLDNDMPVFAYSSIGRGFFSGRINRENYKSIVDGACLTAYCHEVNFKRLDRVELLAKEKSLSVAQIAIAYIVNTNLNVFPLVCVMNKGEFEEDVTAADLKLTEKEMKWLNLEID